MKNDTVKKVLEMKTYKITIAEAITYKQFVCKISAESEIHAKEKAKKDFSLQFPEYMFHFQIIMCNEIFFDRPIITRQPSEDPVLLFPSPQGEGEKDKNE